MAKYKTIFSDKNCVSIFSRPHETSFKWGI